MTYRLFPSTNGPASSTSFGPGIIVGTLFKVTTTGVVLQGYWFWRCDSGQASSASFALWQATGTGTGSLVSNSTASISGMVAGQWNYVALGTPLALTSGTAYKVQVGFTGNFPQTQNQFGSGQPFAAGITQGPLFAFSDSGGSAPDSFGDTQCSFSTGNSDPTSGYVTTANSSWNCWADVQVSDPPAGVTPGKSTPGTGPSAAASSGAAGPSALPGTGSTGRSAPGSG